MKNTKLKFNNFLIEKYKKFLEISNFEQDYSSRTSTGFHKLGHDSIRLMKGICYYDKSHYENSNFYDLMASILICLKK